MTAVLFDTLSLARKLEEAGFPSEQAQATSAAFAEILTGEVATSRDISESRIALEHRFDATDTKIEAVRYDLEAKIESVRQELDAKIESVRQELDAKIESVRQDLERQIESLRHDLEAQIEGVRQELRALALKVDRLEEKLDGQARDLEQRLTIRLGAMMAVGIGVVAVLVRLL